MIYVILYNNRIATILDYFTCKYEYKKFKF